MRQPRCTAIKLREPTSRGLSAGSMNLSTSLDPADKPRDLGEENALNLLAVQPGRCLKFFSSLSLIMGLCSVLAAGTSFAAEKIEYEIKGIYSDAKKNIKERLDEIAKQDHISINQLSEDDLEKQIKKAISPFGYFTPQVRVSKEKNKLIIFVIPGRQTRVSQMIVRLTGEGADSLKIVEASQDLPLKRGDPFYSKTYEDCKTALLTAAEHEGYLKANFETSEVIVDRRQASANVTLVFNTGQRYYYGQLRFDPKYLSSELLSRYASFHYGEPYSTDEIIKLNNDLSASGYFSSVLVRPDINSEKYVPINVHTQPVPRYSYSIGAGYGTDTGPRGRLLLNVIPVNNKGHKFNAILQGSAVDSAAQLQYLIPGQNPVTDQYILGGGYSHQNYDSGRSDSILFSAAQRHFTPKFQRTLSINALSDNYYYTQTNDQRQKQFLLYPKGSVNFLHTPDPMFSPSGYSLNLNILGAAHGVGSEVDLFQAFGDGKAAYQFESIRTRFLVHGILGYNVISDINNLPYSLSFFLGGADDMKAYPINSIGPGKMILYGGLEVQKETIDKWYIIGFVDTGDVFQPSPRQLKQDVGGGLMWVSPVGPIKAGLAWAVNQRFQRVRGRRPQIVINMGPDI